MSMQSEDHRPVQLRRWILILGLSLFAGAILVWLPSLAKSQRSETRWETVLYEDFSGPLSSSWTLIDTSDTDDGEYYWGIETYTYTSPIASLWSVGDGADGSKLTAGTHNYLDNVDSWAIYGPVDVSQAFDGDLSFNWWLDTAPGAAAVAGSVRLLEATAAPSRGDWLGWCVLSDPTNLEDCAGTYVSGSAGRWLSGTLSLEPHIKAARTTTESQSIWLAFRFISDDDGRVGRGAFLDNVVLRLNYGHDVYLSMVRLEPTPTPAPTPTPSEYYDDFDDSSSGWPHGRGEIWDPNEGRVSGYWYRGYHGGEYRIYVEDADCWTCDWFKQPDALAPYRPTSNKYCVETAVKFEKVQYWANMGMVFGANDDNSTLYALCLSADTDPNHLGWYLARQDDYKPDLFGCSKREFTIDGEGREGTKHTGWNRLQVGVDGDRVKVYIGGDYKGQYTMPGLSSMTRVGVVGGGAEILPVDIRYSYFKVQPNAACTP